MLLRTQALDTGKIWLWKPQQTPGPVGGKLHWDGNLSFPISPFKGNDNFLTTKRNKSDIQNTLRRKNPEKHELVIFIQLDQDRTNVAKLSE